MLHILVDLSAQRIGGWIADDLPHPFQELKLQDLTVEVSVEVNK